jgi:NitT/TauT family transport system substrate-binding protein
VRPAEACVLELDYRMRNSAVRQLIALGDSKKNTKAPLRRPPTKRPETSAKFVSRAVLLTAYLCLSGAAIAEEVAKLPLAISSAPIMPYTNGIVAAQHGFFADQGFELSRKVLGNYSVIVSALASGQVEVVTLSIDSLIRAHANGLDWKLLYQTDIYESANADAVLVSRPDIDITSAKDLEGKSVAVATGGISEAALRGWISDNGADPSKVRILDVPFTQIIGSLQSKTLDAGHIVEPFMTTALGNGSAKFVAKHLDSIAKRFMISGFVAKSSWIAENPEKARRFVAAMNASTRFVLDHPQEVLPILAKETRIDQAVLSQFFPQHYVISTTVRPEEIQSVIDFMAKQKQIEKSFDYREIVSEYAPVAK